MSGGVAPIGSGGVQQRHAGMVAGASGGGPKQADATPKEGRTKSQADEGVKQLRAAADGPQQGNGKGGKSGKGGKGAGKRSGKPGWGNGGDGPPGLMRKREQRGAPTQGPAATGGGATKPCEHHPGMVHPVSQTQPQQAQRQTQPQQAQRETQPQQEQRQSQAQSQARSQNGSSVANANGAGRSAQQGMSMSDAVLLGAVGGSYSPQEAQPAPAQRRDDTLHRGVQLPAVGSTEPSFSIQPRNG